MKDIFEGEKQACPCSKECQEFQKLLELKNSGLVVYLHRTHADDGGSTPSLIRKGEADGGAVNPSKDVFIIYNKKNVTITTSELTSEFEKKNISCPRCRKTFEHAQELMQDVKSIDRKIVMGICDHCRKKSQTTVKPFCDCDQIVKKFMYVNSELKEDTKKYDKELFPTDIGFPRTGATLKKQEKTRTYSDIQINLGPSSPSRHEPDVKPMFYSYADLKSDKTEISETGSREIYGKQINLGPDFQPMFYSYTDLKSDKTEISETDSREFYRQQGVTFIQPTEPHEGVHAKISASSLLESDTSHIDTFKDVKEFPRPSLKHHKQEDIFEDIPSLDAKEALKRRHDLSLRQMMRLDMDTEDPHSVSKRTEVYEAPKISPWEQMETKKYHVGSKTDIKKISTPTKTKSIQDQMETILKYHVGSKTDIKTVPTKTKSKQDRSARDLDDLDDPNRQIRSLRASERKIQDSYFEPSKFDKKHHDKILKMDEELKTQRSADKTDIKKISTKTKPIQDQMDTILKYHVGSKTDIKTISTKTKSKQDRSARDLDDLDDPNRQIRPLRATQRKIQDSYFEPSKFDKKYHDTILKKDEELKTQRSVDKIRHKMKKTKQVSKSEFQASIEDVLKRDFSFSFPKVKEKKIKKLKVGVRSSVLLKDVQEMYALKAEGEKEKLEQALKKKLAREEKKQQALQDKKKYAEEQKILTEKGNRGELVSEIGGEPVDVKKDTELISKRQSKTKKGIEEKHKSKEKDDDEEAKTKKGIVENPRPKAKGDDEEAKTKKGIEEKPKPKEKGDDKEAKTKKGIEEKPKPKEKGDDKEAKTKKGIEEKPKLKEKGDDKEAKTKKGIEEKPKPKEKGDDKEVKTKKGIEEKPKPKEKGDDKVAKTKKGIEEKPKPKEKGDDKEAKTKKGIEEKPKPKEKGDDKEAKTKKGIEEKPKLKEKGDDKEAKTKKGIDEKPKLIKKGDDKEAKTKKGIEEKPKPKEKGDDKEVKTKKGIEEKPEPKEKGEVGEAKTKKGIDEKPKLIKKGDDEEAKTKKGIEEKPEPKEKGDDKEAKTKKGIEEKPKTEEKGTVEESALNKKAELDKIQQEKKDLEMQALIKQTTIEKKLMKKEKDDATSKKEKQEKDATSKKIKQEKHATSKKEKQEKDATSKKEKQENDATSKKAKRTKNTGEDSADEIKLSKIKIQKSSSKEIDDFSVKKKESKPKSSVKEPPQMTAAEFQKLRAEHLKDKAERQKAKQIELQAKELEKNSRKSQKGELKIGKIKIKKRNSNDILKSIGIRQTKSKMKRFDIKPLVLKHHRNYHIQHGHQLLSCSLCFDSEMELDNLSLEMKKKPPKEKTDIIIGENILKCRPRLKKIKKQEVVPIFFQKDFVAEHDHRTEEEVQIIPEETKPVQDKQILGTAELGPGKGIIRYALSDRSFIDKGWTILPTEKVVRKMNVYRMYPAHPEFDWFEHNKNKGLMSYDTGERLAEFDNNGRGRWYYRSGRLALDYYDTEETNAQQRFVIYSSGEPDERGRTYPVTILATFDYLGNGIVFDHAGKIRLKYNQTEGVVLDRAIGPATHWQWHSLNDPPVLQQVMIDTKIPQKDPKNLKLGSRSDPKIDTNEDMLAIEFENFIKEKTKKLSQKFKPFQIKMKAMKINEHFSLKILDQATVYLIYRDGTTNMKLNIGMLLDHKEIVDTDTAELGEVFNSLERYPARTDSLVILQAGVANAQRYERQRTNRERLLRPQDPASADILTAATSPPMRLPLITVPTGTSSSTGQCTGHCSRKPLDNLYYNTRYVF